MNPGTVNLVMEIRELREDGSAKVNLTKGSVFERRKRGHTINLRQTTDVETPVTKADRYIACTTYETNKS